MDHLRLQLYRNNPKLAGDQLKDLLDDYHKVESENMFHRVKGEELDTSLLEEILPYVLTDTFFDYLYNHCKFRFNLTRYFPKALESNQQFIDLVIKYDPMSAFEIPNVDMITLEHLKYVETYLINNPEYVLEVKSLPEIFKDSEIIFERVLKGYFDSKSIYDEIDLFDILEIYYTKPLFYRKIFETFRENDFYIIKKVYDFSSRKCLENDEILENVLTLDIECLECIPEEYMEKVSTYVADLIICDFDNNVSYFFETLRPVPDNIKKLANYKVIVDAIFSFSEIGAYRCLFEEMNIEHLEEKHFKIFFNYLEREHATIRPKNFFSSPKFLSIVLNNMDFRYIDPYNFYHFDISAYDDANVTYIVRYLFSFNPKMRMYFFERLYTNDVYMSELLAYLKLDLANNWDFMKYYKYHDIFNRTNVDYTKVSPVIYEIIDVLAEHNILKYNTFANKWWKCKEFINKIQEEKCISSIIKEMFRSFRTLINGYHDSHPMYDNSVMFYAYIEECTNYILADDNSIIKESLKYIRYFNIDYTNDSRLLQFVDLLMSKDLFDKCEFSTKFWSSNDIYIYFLEKNYYKYYNRFDVSRMLDDSRIINLLFRTLKFNDFVEQFKKSDSLEVLISKIEINSIEDFQHLFYKLEEVINPQRCAALSLFLIIKYKNSGLNDEKINELCDIYLDESKYEMLENFRWSSYVDVLFEKILNGERNPFTLEFMSSHKPSLLYVAANYVDILTENDSLNIHESYSFIYENVNKKHIREIIKLLKFFGEISDCERFDIALKMYVAIGYHRCKDLLSKDINKNYGVVNILTLQKLFGVVDLNNVVLVRKGTGYVPLENSVLINLMFGANYKDKTSPIYHYLNDFEDKRKEVDLRIQEIRNSDELSNDEKVSITRELKQKFNEYCEQVKYFIDNFDVLFNKWDIIEEEFLKAQNKSKLELTLNVSTAISMIKRIEIMRERCELESRDEPLKRTDVFDYVGRDTQFTVNPSMAPKRAITLSRRMESVHRKKFPDITIEDGDYTLSVYAPQDRRILSAGYRTNCCFRPNGNADNHGSDNSLLNYCVSTEYGGGIEICNSEGDTIMFSPLLRNGNVLMIHSIESKYLNDKEKMVRVQAMLVKYAEEVIRVANECGDKIDYVVMTDLHSIDYTQIKGRLPDHKEFVVYNVANEFGGMYTNLDNGHMILASKEGAVINDIEYGEVSYSYDYPFEDEDYEFSFQVSVDELNSIHSLQNMNNEIINIANNRAVARNKGDWILSNQLLEEIKRIKKDYLKVLKKLLKGRRGINLYEEYQRAISTIDSINKRLGLNKTFDFVEIYYSSNWYIAITKNNKIIVGCLPGYEELVKEKVQEVKNDRPILTQDVSNGFRL